MTIDICPDYGDIVSELVKENENLSARIAELEAFVDQLIEAGERVAMEELNSYYSWSLLIEGWKEREE